MSKFAEGFGKPVPLLIYYNKQHRIMNNSETINLIKESFEIWYNSKLHPDDNPVSIAVNYSDIQTLSIKAYHTIRMEVQAIGIRDGKSFITPLLLLQENYNHGVTSEQEAKEGLTKKMLIQMFDYPASTIVCQS